MRSPRVAVDVVLSGHSPSQRLAPALYGYSFCWMSAAGVASPVPLALASGASGALIAHGTLLLLRSKWLYNTTRPSKSNGIRTPVSLLLPEKSAGIMDAVNRYSSGEATVSALLGFFYR